ncbi:putative succinate-semialdehyde dehydrogenase [Rosellinia necatrix]|uniref:Putative succinate-semialdehyde dehydrogenase n=1 Tax=Rosellinia necatrix TaxID=77044 RepID=A0A1W2TBN6_ROSNE|nr:putative succinate-semialdehyde dehydrogenase [Rosellinia necatrix]
MWIMMLVELALTVTLLVLTALAQPDTYRTELWKAGYQLGFNSSPNYRTFEQANGKPKSPIPFVWSSTLTDYNVAIAIISLFFLITKLIAFIMDFWLPIIVLPINIAFVGLYAASLGGQAGPDYLDPSRPSRVAWYIAKPCSVAASHKIQGFCTSAKGTFAAFSLMFVVTLVNLGLTIWAMLPNERDKRDWDSDDEDDEPLGAGAGSNRKGSAWEMQSMPTTPRTGLMPYTPRTTAFNTLDKKNPARYQ